MRGGRGAKAVAVAVAAVGAVAMMAVPASADDAPGCEHMLPPEDCEKYYYGTFQTLGELTSPIYQAANDTVDTAFDVAIWAGATYDCVVWGSRCDQ